MPPPPASRNQAPRLCRHLCPLLRRPLFCSPAEPPGPSGRPSPPPSLVPLPGASDAFPPPTRSSEPQARTHVQCPLEAGVGTERAQHPESQPDNTPECEVPRNELALGQGWGTPFLPIWVLRPSCGGHSRGSAYKSACCEVQCFPHSPQRPGQGCARTGGPPPLLQAMPSSLTLSRTWRACGAPLPPAWLGAPPVGRWLLIPMGQLSTRPVASGPHSPALAATGSGQSEPVHSVFAGIGVALESLQGWVGADVRGEQGLVLGEPCLTTAALHPWTAPSRPQSGGSQDSAV